MITLRDYQKEVIDKTKYWLRKGEKHIMVQLPTGGGKTIVFSFITQNASLKDKKILILTDRDELLKQAGGTMEKFRIQSGKIKAGSKYIDHRFNVYVAMSQTLRNRLDKEEWRDFILNDIDMIIIDEAHIQEFNYIFEDGILNNKIVLGFTATPHRSGKMRQLGTDYSRMVRGAEVKDLIEAGYLVNCDHYEFEAPSMKNVSLNSKTGDFNSDSMFKQFDNAKTYKGLVKNYQKYYDGKKMIVFCCNVNHAIKTTQELSKAGYKVKFLASEKGIPKAPPETASVADQIKYEEKLKEFDFWKENFEKYSGTRKQVLEAFSKDEFIILVNVDILTKGYDEPSIEVVALYRATNSLTLYLQMLGRGSRIFPNKVAFGVLDFGGNKSRLGTYDENREWSLWHETKKGESGVPPMKQCGIDSNNVEFTGSGSVKKGCTRLIMMSQNICPYCGFKYPEKDEAREVELFLSSIKDENGVSLNVKTFKQMTFEELKKYREIKKHKSSWLWIQLYHRGGTQEIQKFGNHFHWSQKMINQAIQYVNNTLK